MKQLDLASGPVVWQNQFDVCVVGAGAVGILLTLKLLRSGLSVILVESGGKSFEDATQDLYRSEVAGQPHTGVHTGRFRTWGGTTTRWGGQILELEPIDFAKRDWVKYSGWPIGLQQLAPFYREALKLEGVSDSILDDVAVWRSISSPEPQLGSYLEPYFTRWCPQPNFAELHGRELADAEHLTVLLHANLVDAEMGDVGRPLNGLVFRSLSGHETTVPARQFVLAIGTVETSRMLLHLEERHAGRWNPNGQVGLGFQDHVDCNAAKVQPLDRDRFQAAFTNVLIGGYKYHPKFRLSADAQRDALILNVAATMTFHDDSEELVASIKQTGKRLLRRAWKEIDWPQIKRLLCNLPTLFQHTWSFAVKHRVFVRPTSAIALRVHCEQEPMGESRVSLTEERDALGVRRSKLDWRISPLELHTVRVFVQMVSEAFESAGLAKITPVAALEDDDTMRAICDDGLHHIGGAAMSTDPTTGVVDPDLRMFGIPNLSLCSAAVFPTGGYSNPTHTTLALALRLGDRLTKELQSEGKNAC